MVNLKDVHAANRELVKTRDLVCVVAGATNGIGEGTLRQLATTSGSEPSAKSLRVYIVARKPAVVDALVVDLQKSCPKGVFIPIQCSDLALLKNVDQACDEITRLERQRDGEQAKIDVMLLTQGYLDPFGGRTETSEGIESKMSLHFYSRMRMIHKLLPLLTTRAAGDEPAHIISVYAGGMETSGKMFPDDLALRDPKHYSFANSRATVIHMKTMFFEHLANDYPGKLSLVHVFPGLVITASSDTLTKPPYPLWFRIACKAMLPIARMTVNIPIAESGQRTLFLATSRYASYADKEAKATTTLTGLPVASATNGVLGGGAYACDAKDETVDVAKHYVQLRKDGFYDAVWTHVMDVFDTVTAGRNFAK